MEVLHFQLGSRSFSSRDVHCLETLYHIFHGISEFVPNFHHTDFCHTKLCPYQTPLPPPPRYWAYSPTALTPHSCRSYTLDGATKDIFFPSSFPRLLSESRSFPLQMERCDPTLHCAIGPVGPAPTHPRPWLWTVVTALACVASAALLVVARPPSPPATAVLHTEPLHTEPLARTRASGFRSVPAPQPRAAVRRGAAADERDAPPAPAWPRWPRERTPERPAPEAPATAEPDAGAVGPPLRNFPGALVAVPGLVASTGLTGFWDRPHALSTALGLLAAGVWLASSVPQLVQTFRSRSAADISPQFAALRVVGDVGMVVGLGLIEGQASQVAVAWYFLVADLVMLLQWCVFEGPQTAGTPPLDRRHWPHVVAGAVCVWGVAAFCQQLDPSAIGTCSGWGASLLLSGARVPQIRHILRSRRVAGLSPALFGLNICGNVAQMAAVVAYSADGYYLAAQMPFLLGCGAPIILDAIIVALIARFSATPPKPTPPVQIPQAQDRRGPYV